MASSKAKNVGLPVMNLIRTKAMPILEQLKLEEKLLRTSSENWCIVNDGTKQPTIVMGVSGKLTELVELEPVLRDGIPVIRRFSGGGTVIVDKNTVFISFLCNKDAMPELQPYPHPIMSWTGKLYKEALNEFANFHLRENDYAFDHRKFGGNAQSIIKNRWIHHTSFLWDYDLNSMSYLKLPHKAPKYRLARPHTEFLCRMKDYIPSRLIFIEKMIASLGRYFFINSVQLDEVSSPLNEFQSLSTKLLTRQELEQAFLSNSSPLLSDPGH